MYIYKVCLFYLNFIYIYIIYFINLNIIQHNIYSKLYLMHDRHRYDNALLGLYGKYNGN